MLRRVHQANHTLFDITNSYGQRPEPNCLLDDTRRFVTLTNFRSFRKSFFQRLSEILSFERPQARHPFHKSGIRGI